jgi:hypothetical protein
METQIPESVLSRTLKMHSEIVEGPRTLQDVTIPGSLASYVGEKGWAPLVEIAEARDAARAQLAAIQLKQAEVAQAIQAKGTRRVKDVEALADAALRGEVPWEAPEKRPEGISALPADTLQSIADGLRAKHRAALENVSWIEGKLRTAACDLLRQVAGTIAIEYARQIETASSLHVLLDACHMMIGQVTPEGFRKETFLAPIVGTGFPRIRGWDNGDYLARFESASGTPSIKQGWADAVKAATGFDAVSR